MIPAVLGNVIEHLKTTSASVVRVFARVDADGSGSLDLLELQEAFRKMSQDLSELEVEEVRFHAPFPGPDTARHPRLSCHSSFTV